MNRYSHRKHSLVVRDELGDDERDRLDSHVEGCVECRQDRALHESNRLLLSALRPEPAPPALRQAVLSRVYDTRSHLRAPEPPLWRRPVTWLTVAVSLLALLLASPVRGAVAQLFDQGLPTPQPVVLYKLNLTSLTPSTSTTAVSRDQAEQTIRSAYPNGPIREMSLDLVRSRSTVLDNHLCWVAGVEVPPGTTNSSVPPVGAVVEPGEDLVVFVDAQSGTILMAQPVPAPPVGTPSVRRSSTGKGTARKP
jgi:hypothetical protein